MPRRSTRLAARRDGGGGDDDELLPIAAAKPARRAAPRADPAAAKLRAAVKFGRVKLQARKLKKRAQELFAELAVAKSLRSSRSWSVRRWSSHEESSPREMEFHDYLEYPDHQATMVNVLAANLGDMHTRQIDMSNADDVAAELEASQSLFTAYHIRVEKDRVSNGWRLDGISAKTINAVLQEALKTIGLRRDSLTYEMVAVSLGRALREVEKLRVIDEARGVTFYRRVQQRRLSDVHAGRGGVTADIYRTVAKGRRLRRVVGMGELRHYRLPDDLVKWLAAKRITYKANLNPRLRQKKKACSGAGKKRVCVSIPRARFVWGYNFGLDKAKADKMLGWLADKKLISHVDKRRNWHSIWPSVFELKVASAEDVGPRIEEAKKFMANVLKQSHDKKRGYVVYCAFRTMGGAGHANIMAVQVLKGADGKLSRVVARIMDPHASAHHTRFTAATRTALTSIMNHAMHALTKGAPHAGVDIGTCGFTSLLKNALRVQYGLEGVCGPSSMALLLSAARELMPSAGDKRSGRKRIDNPQFCRRVYSHVRIQDAVLVMQIVHRL
jgi:hypothetical protein